MLLVYMACFLFHAAALCTGQAHGTGEQRARTGKALLANHACFKQAAEAETPQILLLKPV
jgi:hypothetical protein